jgi:peptidoglycan/xylan/chitin deacetylase (PgdA/CDA1 family)
VKSIIRDFSFKALLEILKISGVHNLFRPIYGGIGHIFKFHRVIPASKNGVRFNLDLEITPAELENCLKYCLENDYQIISLDELHYFLKEKKGKPPKRFALFTFDDGYVDTYHYAYPIFMKYEVPFSINISPGLIDREATVWWYLLENLLLHHQTLIVDGDREPITYKCGKRLEKYIAFRRLRQQVLTAEEPGHNNPLEQLFARYQVDAPSESASLLMTWDQVQNMSRNSLVTIAAHTDHHLPLSRLSEKEVREEIIGSREKIEQHIGKKVEHFAYPFGHREAGRREFAIIKSLNFKTGITTRFGNIFPEHQHHLESLPSLYKIGTIAKDKFLDVFTSGAVSALAYKMKKVITI